MARVFSAGLAIAALLPACVLSLCVFDPRCGTRATRLVAIGCYAALVGIVVVNWPIYLSHRLVRSRLEEIAQQAREGVIPESPLRVGLFTIEAIEVRERGRFTSQVPVSESGATDLKNIVCLWLSRRHETLIAQCAVSRPMFNVFTMSALDDRWVFVTED